MIFFRWLALSLALLFVAWLFPGISMDGIVPAFFSVLLIGVVNVVIRPVLIFITAPINILTLGLFTFVINAVLFMFVANLIPGFNVDGFSQALFGAILYSILSAFINRDDII